MGKSTNSSDFTKSYDLGRPPNIKRLFPNSRALIVSGKVVDRALSSGKIREQVLYKCRRRCCVCYALHGDMRVKHGQIVHLDRNRKNCNEENLAFLCQEHHPLYDSKSYQIVGYSPDEVRLYRELLYQSLYQELPY